MQTQNVNYEFFKFPAGEVHVKDSRPSLDHGPIFVPIDGDNLSDWIMKILLLTNIKRRQGHRLELYIPYLPYSRQDRPTSPNEPFSLQVIGDIINAQGYQKVYTLDVHSDVAHGCIRNLVNIPVDFIVHEFPNNTNFRDCVLVIPDQGAYKRLQKMAPLFKGVAVALKHRDTETGKLRIDALHGDVYGEHCLIVDDICDGGGTFVMLAELLEEKGAAKVDLFVTHGIFSKGVELERIDEIYTTNSFREVNDHSWEHLTVIDVMEVLKNYVE